MIFNGLFSAIGFGTFETVKGILGVDESNEKNESVTSHRTDGKRKINRNGTHK